MRASTQEYIRLQTMYKARAQEEKATFVSILRGIKGGDVLAGQGEVWPLSLPLLFELVVEFGTFSLWIAF